MSNHVECQTHGTAGAAFICSHALEAYSAGTVLPFFWTDATKPEPCGWCSDCQSRFISAGEEWIGEADRKLDAKLICEHCFRDVIKFNGYQ